MTRPNITQVISDTKKEVQNRWKREEIINLPEWYQPMYNGEGSCPWCENMQHEGHDPECNRSIVKEILVTALS